MRPDLLALAASLSARGERFALVTVVRREPPSSARVGDTALITHGGDYHGWAGGGCTRETVVREAQRAMADGEPRLLCISPEMNAKPRAGMLAVAMTCDSGGTVEIYVEPVLPVARLVLFGDTPAVQALARIGEAMGYRVERGPEASVRDAHVLVGTMGDEDLEVLQKVLRGEPAYVGVIASRKRFDQVAERAQAQLERRQQAHASREHFRVGPVAGEQADRFVERAGAVVVELRGNHALTPFSRNLVRQPAQQK